MKKNVELSIIIVTYNHRAYLSGCLKSIKESVNKVNYRIFVIDNNSSDGTIETILGRPRKSVNITRNKKNLGFAKACNIGINLISADYYLILNPDIISEKDSINRMIDFLKRHKQASCAVPVLNNFDGSIQYSCRKFPGWKETVLKRTPLRWLFDFEDVNKYDENRMRVISKNVPFRIDWALGGCVMIKKSSLEKIGLFDERFFLYCEDIDWFYRLKKANLAAYCFPESIMRHKHLAVSDHKFFSIESYYHFIGIMKFIVKHFNDILTGQYEL